jgi:phosphoglycerol geranylgeranyltransferase
MRQSILSEINENSQLNKKQLAVLVDPDKFKTNEIISAALDARIDYFFAGGSLLTNGDLDETLKELRATGIPVILFPGSIMQINKNADAILLLSLISGRNPEMLIGNHVLAAPSLKASGLELMPTGYILVESGRSTTVSYMSNTTPIPYDKEDIAVCTAMAGEMLGLKLIYMDAGSGAEKPVSESMISAVKENISVPLIVGGGIRSGEAAYLSCKAGADIVVIGNAFEKDPSLLKNVSEAIRSLNVSQAIK